MRNVLVGSLMGCLLAGCAAGPTTTTAGGAVTPAAKGGAPSKDAPAQVAAPVAQPAAAPGDETGRKAHAGPWIGAAGASDFVLPGAQDTQLGVWVDVPAELRKARVPAAVSLVVDVSGSMAGDKIVHARAAARAFIDGLSDGDIVSVATFSDNAQEIVPPTVLSRSTRRAVLASVEGLQPNGSTNMFDGLRLGEGRAVTSPPTHSVRRVVLISDGQANIGPSSPEVLGALAQRGADRGVQVTSLGVGVDYDERTLNALAVASSGRLYHLTESREMASIMEKELSLLQATAATDAFVEIVPAPGVQLVSVDGVRADWSGGALRVPLGTMFGGQHREMLVRVRVTAPPEGTHALASVRLHFRDPGEGNLERVQEVIARYQVTSDAQVVASRQNARTQTIAAMMDAGKAAVEAAQQVNTGNFAAAEQQLAAAEAKLRDTAARARSAEEKERAVAAASVMAQQRGAARAAAAKPKAAQRADALEMNSTGMKAMGF
jgi:Ca-activated chloride channel family protein